jgi:hypothetical protein
MTYTSEMNETITNLYPHYTQGYFMQARSVFVRNGYSLAEGYFGTEHVPDASYVYSDRISHERKTLANDTLRQIENKRTAEYIEKWLQIALQQPDIILVHILAQVNLSDGYPVQVLGYMLRKSDTPEQLAHRRKTNDLHA